MTTDSTTQALAQLAQAAVLVENATAALGQAEPDPGHAAYFAWLVEQVGQQLTRAQIHAADALRRTGAHQLDEPSYQAIADAGLRPTDADLELTRGQRTAGRSYYKDTAGMLKEWLNLGIGAAKARVLQAEALIAEVGEAGERLAPRYPQLGQEFQRAETEPRLVLGAATQLRKAEPVLLQAPDSQQARSELEADAIALIRHEPSTARKHLAGVIEQALGEDRPLEAMLSEVGLFRSGMRRGLVHYRLSMLPQDAELIESMCAQIDNPATIAGNREELMRLVFEQYMAHGQGAGADDPAQPRPQPEWGEAEAMPQWAQPEDPTPDTEGQRPTATPTPLDPPAPAAGPGQDRDATKGTEDHASTEQATEQQATGSPHPRSTATPVAGATLDGTGKTIPDPEQDPASDAPASEPVSNCPTTIAEDLINDGMPVELSLPFEELRPEFRHLIALIGIMRAGGKSDGKQAGLVQPQITVVLDYFKMMTLGKNFAVTESGLPLAAGAARTMMCNAGIMPVIFGGNSKILDIAQESRFFPKYMRKALQAKYRGCAYPGCTMPASRCEVDHIKPWEEGGATSVDNGCLFCPMHHHARHCGLFTVIANEGGPPMVLLPKNLDPHQRPRLNTYWYSPSEAIRIAREATAA
ncbi:hypothetical protein OK351_05840 [Glutamicibacter sp. MNS18]|uniref:HNH endonuclease signature motif containing protein n=1 Tax=Glutamicibacter sp. MNS18 TaxID=2989817 RepID=UPI0022369773|nr:HNH endonuclease [Glutamicibacter sp. MNS18]MCW4465023.1 hypothetical protein [Glutamicibacter sp. MNS18]